MGENLFQTADVADLEPGDKVLFAGRKEQLTVQELNNLDTDDALPYARLEGPRGGEVYVKEQQDGGLSGPTGNFDGMKVERPTEEAPGLDAPQALVEHVAADVFGLGMVDNIRVADVRNVDDRERIAVEFSPMPTTTERTEFNNALRDAGAEIQYLDPPVLYVFMGQK